MPPKKTKKADDGESSAVMNRKLHMDSRDVEAKAPSIDPASEAKRLDAAVEEARIGIGYINVLTIANPLKFGTYNERPEKETETNKMVTSFDMHGIQSLKETNALCVIVKRSRLATGQTFAGQWTKEESLQEIQFNDNAEIVFASGQHRVAALKKMNTNTLDELSALVKRNTKLTELENPTEEQVEEQHEIREQIGEAKGKLKRLGKWGVILYDEEMLLKDSKDLARHLSRNQTLHVYAETNEELLMTIIRNLEDACDAKGEVGAKDRLRSELKQPDRSQNTRLTRVLHFERLMLCLVKDLLPLGDHFRRRPEFKAAWLARNIDIQMGMHVQFIKRHVMVMQSVVSRDNFTTRAEVRAALKKLDEDTPEGEAAWVKVRKWREDIMAGEPGEHCIFAEFIPTFDELAQKLCSGGMAISWDDTYVNGLAEYTREVCENLRSVWLSKGNKKTSPEDATFFDAVLARMLVVMTPDKQMDYLPDPLLSGCVLDYAWTSMGAVVEGLKEVARWFEPLVDWHKLLWQQSHGMDDATETIFRALERDKGYDGIQAVNRVYDILWRKREELLLPLHNKMSSLAMQATMKSRPVDKASMKAQMDELEDVYQQSTTAMFNVAKKMTGKKQTEPTAGEMKTYGMNALVACTPDWRRESTAKNRVRDLKPMIHAITLEVILVEKYREDLIESNILVAVLREKLQISLQGVERVTQMSLVPETSQRGGSQLAKLGVRKRVVFWDHIPLPEKRDDTDKRIADELKVEHLRSKKQFDRESRDRDVIKKVVSACTSVPIARVNYGSHSGVAVEVADAVNALIKAYELNSARLRLRELHEDETIVFNTAVHTEKLFVDEVEGVKDEYTVKPASPSGDPESTNAIDGQPKRKPKPTPVPKKIVRGKDKDKEVLASDNNMHASVNDHDVPEDTQQLEPRRQPSVNLDIRDTMQQVEPQIPESDTVAPVTSSSTAIAEIDPVSTSATSDNAPSDPTAVASSNEKKNVHSLSSKGSTNDDTIHDDIPDIDPGSDMSDIEVIDTSPNPLPSDAIEETAAVSDPEILADSSPAPLGLGRGKGRGRGRGRAPVISAPVSTRSSVAASVAAPTIPSSLPEVPATKRSRDSGGSSPEVKKKAKRDGASSAGPVEVHNFPDM